MKHKRQQIIFTAIVCVLWGISIIAGIASIVYGSNVLDQYASYRYYGLYDAFGTDYYTYMYQTNAMAANSAYATFEAVQEGLGGLLIVLGIALFALSAYQIVKNVYKLIVLQNTTQINAETQSNKNNEDFQNELLILKNLFEAGAITEQEYEIKKKEILGL